MTTKVGQILIELGVLRQGPLQAALAEQRRSGGRLGAILLERSLVTPGDLARALAIQKGIPWVSAEDLRPDPEVLAMIDPATARAFVALPLERKNGRLRVALADPETLPLLGDLEGLTGMPVEVVLSDPDELGRAVENAYRAQEKVRRAAVEEASEAAPIVRLLDSILIRAVRDRAADIHFEPFQGEFRIRFRVDGVLYEIDPPPAHLATALISRIKVLANLDISETRMPQDGRIEYQVDGRSVDIRVSTVPIQGGESVVLRILDRENLQLDLSRLGLQEGDRRQLEQFISLPHGIVLVTGPTGSGKTTTLYSLMSLANREEKKLLTVEDPVEYDLEGIVQIPVQESIGVDYARVLRTMLRQDPDIILVGEIRDPETARIAVEASLTGHLVLSTLHTNDAPSTITRLVDLGVEPFLLAATLEGVVAQRLVRCVCKSCAAPYSPPRSRLDRAGIPAGARFLKGKGCDACHFTGYSGRTAIFEILEMDEDIREQFLHDPSTIALRKAARQRRMVTLRERGLELARQGGTTLEEVLRETAGEGE
ncbi:MAG: GspE/PulE family protein [Planctomycetota bacterium]